MTPTLQVLNSTLSTNCYHNTIKSTLPIWVLVTWEHICHIQVLLGISLLQQCTPKLIVILRVYEDQLSIMCWKSIINHDVYPFSKVPETEVKGSTILASFERLVFYRNYLVIHRLHQLSHFCYAFITYSL